MATKRITDLSTSTALAGGELIEVSQLSATVRIAAATLSATAADNSFNDSAGGFLSAGFAVGDRVNSSGWSGFAANNVKSLVITTLTANKMTFAGTDGDVIIDAPAGNPIVLSKWTSAATSAADIAALADAGGGSADYPPFDDNAGKVLAVNDTEDGVEWIDPPEGGGGGSGINVVSVAPSIVQKASYRSKNASGSVNLPVAPTPGNMLVMLYTGSGGNSAPVPTTFSIVEYQMNDNTVSGTSAYRRGTQFQGSWVATRRVVIGDGTNWAVAAGADVGNWLLLEVTDFDLISAEVAAVQVTGTKFVLNRKRVPWAALNLVELQHDATAIATVTSPANKIQDFTNNYNHVAHVYTVPDSGDMVGSYSAAPSYPMAIVVSLGKYMGSASANIAAKPDRHRYWRVAMPPLIGDFYGYGFAELQFRTSKGGGQAAVGGTPFGSPVADGTLAGAFDSDPATFWACSFGSNTQKAQTEFYLGYDFVTPIDIVEVMMRARNDAGVNGARQLPWVGRIEFSDDGVHYTTAWSYSFPYPAAAGETHVLSRPATVVGFTADDRAPNDRYAPPRTDSLPIKLGTFTATPVGKHGLKYEVAGGGANNSILMKPIQATAFSVVTRVTNNINGNYRGNGIWFRGTNGRFTSFGYSNDGGWVGRITAWNSLNNYNTNIATAGVRNTFNWIRCDYDPTTNMITAYISEDGVCWMGLGSSDFAGPIDAYGLGVNTDNLAVTCLWSYFKDGTADDGVDM